MESLLIAALQLVCFGLAVFDLLLLAWACGLVRTALALRAQERMLRLENAELRKELSRRTDVLRTAMCECHEQLGRSGI